MPSRQTKPSLTRKCLKNKFQKKYSSLHGQYTGYTSKTVIRRPPRKITFGERRSQFLKNPGHFWNTTNQCHTAIFKLLVEQGKISSDDLDQDFDERTLLDPFETTTYRPDLRSVGDDLLEELHYASDSDSEDESDVETFDVD